MYALEPPTCKLKFRLSEFNSNAASMRAKRYLCSNIKRIIGEDFAPEKKYIIKISKGAKIRNRYNQVPHLTQDTNGKVTNAELDITNESQEVSPFPAGDPKAHINRRVQRHSKHRTEKHKRSIT